MQMRLIHIDRFVIMLPMVWGEDAPLVFEQFELHRD